MRRAPLWSIVGVADATHSGNFLIKFATGFSQSASYGIDVCVCACVYIGAQYASKNLISVDFTRARRGWKSDGVQRRRRRRKAEFLFALIHFAINVKPPYFIMLVCVRVCVCLCLYAYLRVCLCVCE